jgi:hypothetical protein
MPRTGYSGEEDLEGSGQPYRPMYIYKLTSYIYLDFGGF